MDVRGVSAAYQRPEAMCGLAHLAEHLFGGTMWIQSDSAMMVANVNHQGGTGSSVALLEASHFLWWVEFHTLSLSAIYIPDQGK